MLMERIEHVARVEKELERLKSRRLLDQLLNR
jgi:hypothetical protein